MKQITAIAQRPIVKRMVNIARVLFFVLGVVTTVSTSQVFRSCNKPEFPHDAPVGIVPVGGDDHREQERAIAAYNRRIAILNTQNDKLRQQVTVSRAALTQALHSSAVLQVQLQRQADNVVTLTDTAQRLSNCDSLAQTATVLAQTCAEKDSLCNDLTQVLTEQVAIKDSTIGIQGQQYNYLQLSYDRIKAQQQLLISNNLLLQKQVNRHKARSKLLTVGLILVGGTATYMALQH